MTNKYSEWQKIDLHIHTDWSKKTKDNDYAGTFSVTTLHNKLIEQDVKIFSLTDHNIINLPAYKEYYETFTSENDPCLLLGIELDIERNTKTYHSLLIFNCTKYSQAEDISSRIEKKYEDKGSDYKRRTLSTDELIQVFPEDDFFFIPHAGNTSSIIDTYKGEISEAQKMLILLQSPLEKVPEKKRQIFNDNFDTLLYEAFRNRDDYAYIEFSDNHNIQKYPCSNKGDSGDHEFYYIKGSKNYETLRLAFIDPRSRIKSANQYRLINGTSNYIETLVFHSGPNVADTTFEFSPHLNVIIGGRSSGKSLLLDILNRSIDKLEKDNKYSLIEQGLITGIKTKYDASISPMTSIDTTIIQINQGDIVNYFENKKLENLARKTGNIEVYNSKRSQFKNRKAELEGIINELNRDYKNAFDMNVGRKHILHNHTIERLLSSEFLFKMDIDALEKNFSPNRTLSDASILIVSLNKNIDSLRKAKYFSFSLDEMAIIKSFEQLINEKLLVLNKAIEKRKRFDGLIKKISQNISLANSKLSSEGQEKAQAHESIKKISSDTGDIFRALAQAKMTCRKIEAYEISYKEEILLDSESTLCLEVHSEERVSDLIIDGIKNASTENLYLCILELLKNESSVKNYGNNDPESLKKKSNTQLANIYSYFENPSDYLEYKDGSNSKSNSPGYNSEKYLQVILRNPSSSLIIIDQPEDNLGNKFIAEQLVDLIRELKFKKQIFLVTHNPAIVVYGDAEAIILAKNDNNNISYIQIKLEDEWSQKEICSVLDGGEYIFDNRSRKYNIQKLLLKGV